MVSISTVRRYTLTIGLGLALAAFTACGGDSSDPVQEGCERLDECNALADGVSVNECVESVDVALENATPSERSDWETLMSGCLQFDTCNAFLSCVDGNDL